MQTKPMLRILIILTVLALASWATAANIGPDDRRISTTGIDGDPTRDAFTPAIAFDSNEQKYLAVWSADDDDGEFRIWGRLLSGSAGAPLGDAFPISPDLGLTAVDHLQPAVAYSPDHGYYLVVWSSDIFSPGSFEIVGVAVGAGGTVSPTLHRYSDMGTNDADTAFDAVTPDLAWHSFLDAFVITWAADTDEGVDMLDGRFEIYGQLADGLSGAETGTNDFRISFSYSGPVVNDILKPTVAVDPNSDRWWVAFEGDVLSDAVHDPEIWMYWCNGDVPNASGSNISIMGASYDDGLSGRNPDIAYVPSSGELICVWSGEDGSASSPAIYGQRLQLDGTKIGAMINFSDPGGLLYLKEATHPQIAIDPTTDEWFVTWRGGQVTPFVHYDHEVFARRFNDVGNPVDPLPFYLSGMDPSLIPVAGAGAPAVAINSLHGYKLIVWSGDLDSTPGGEHEIYAQAFSDAGASPVEETPAAAFALHGAYPNPFNPQTTIAFDLPRAQPVSLRIYDAAGRLVRTLLHGEPGRAGRNEVKWNGTDDRGRQAASGVYLYRLETERNSVTDRMVLLK